MNKTYADSIERARSIASGIEKNASELSGKGYNTSYSQKLDELAAKLAAEAEKSDKLNEEASAQRQVCHEALAALKDTINEAKTGIKSRYLQPEWLRFGLIDKK